jgi:hypothetical protein
MRVVQPAGTRGSLKWIQRAVNDCPRLLFEALKAAGLKAETIDWRSPLRDDGWAEYRDSSFLARIGHPELSNALREFWPARGPQWDALAIADGEVLLVEAKAHITELLSPPSAAAGRSLEHIERSLAQTIAAFGADPLAPWSRAFYQLANRLAFLHFLSSNGVPARLALVNFVGDEDMAGPASAAVWRSAYEVAFHVMGLPKRHPYASRILEVFPDVARLADVEASGQIAGESDGSGGRPMSSA